MLKNSRFNPAPGLRDFWSEFTRPNPYRWPILALSALPFAVIVFWLSGETVYTEPERPQIDYITTFEPNRTDAQIAASNRANQELKELREADAAARAERKRDLYKALGAATGMDVETIERESERERAAEEAAEQARRDAMFGRSAASGESAAAEGPIDDARGSARADAQRPSP